jgi:hypothetical protein
MPAMYCVMRWCRYLSQVAFVCNLAFLVCVLLQWKSVLPNNAVLSTVVILGYVLAPFVFNPAVTILYAVLLARRKPLAFYVPVWLALVNFIFLVLQLLFILFFLHDTFPA